MKNLLFIFLFGGHILSAQNFVNKVLVLNEGRFDYVNSQIDVPVTIGSYDPITQNYSVLDTIDGARFASDLKIDGYHFYVMADTLLLKYDLNSYELLSSQTVIGGRNIHVSGENIYVTRGEYLLTLPSYLQVYSKSDLELVIEVDTLNGPKWSTQNMVEHDGKLFIAINNGFEWGNEKSLIGVLDLETFNYLEEIDLGIDATNPDNMMIDSNFIYTVNNKDWSGASFSKVDLSTYSTSTINISDVSTGCGTSCLRGDRLNFQLSMDTVLYEWNPVSFEDSGVDLGLQESFYELSFDETNNYLYASSTDYVTYGKVYVYDENNSLISQFDCGVSPGTIVFDIRNTTSITDYLTAEKESKSYYDMSGRKLNSIENQPKGVYIQSGKKVFKK